MAVKHVLTCLRRSQRSVWPEYSGNCKSGSLSLRAWLGRKPSGGGEGWDGGRVFGGTSHAPGQSLWGHPSSPTPPCPSVGTRVKGHAKQAQSGGSKVHRGGASREQHAGAEVPSMFQSIKNASLLLALCLPAPLLSLTGLSTLTPLALPHTRPSLLRRPLSSLPCSSSSPSSLASLLLTSPCSHSLLRVMRSAASALALGASAMSLSQFLPGSTVQASEKPYESAVAGGMPFSPGWHSTGSGGSSRSSAFGPTSAASSPSSDSWHILASPLSGLYSKDRGMSSSSSSSAHGAGAGSRSGVPGASAASLHNLIQYPRPTSATAVAAAAAAAGVGPSNGSPVVCGSVLLSSTIPASTRTHLGHTHSSPSAPSFSSSLLITPQWCGPTVASAAHMPRRTSTLGAERGAPTQVTSACDATSGAGQGEGLGGSGEGQGSVVGSWMDVRCRSGGREWASAVLGSDWELSVSSRSVLGVPEREREQREGRTGEGSRSHTASSGSRCGSKGLSGVGECGKGGDSAAWSTAPSPSVPAVTEGVHGGARVLLPGRAGATGLAVAGSSGQGPMLPPGGGSMGREGVGRLSRVPSWSLLSLELKGRAGGAGEREGQGRERGAGAGQGSGDTLDRKVEQGGAGAEQKNHPQAGVERSGAWGDCGAEHGAGVASGAESSLPCVSSLDDPSTAPTVGSAGLHFGSQSSSSNSRADTGPSSWAEAGGSWQQVEEWSVFPASSSSAPAHNSHAASPSSSWVCPPQPLTSTPGATPLLVPTSPAPSLSSSWAAAAPQCQEEEAGAGARMPEQRRIAGSSRHAVFKGIGPSGSSPPSLSAPRTRKTGTPSLPPLITLERGLAGAEAHLASSMPPASLACASPSSPAPQLRSSLSDASVQLRPRLALLSPHVSHTASASSSAQEDRAVLGPHRDAVRRAQMESALRHSQTRARHAEAAAAAAAHAAGRWHSALLAEMAQNFAQRHWNFALQVENAKLVRMLSAPLSIPMQPTPLLWPMPLPVFWRGLDAPGGGKDVGEEGAGRGGGGSYDPSLLLLSLVFALGVVAGVGGTVVLGFHYGLFVISVAA